MPKTKQNKTQTHRAALDGHTECGIPIDKANLTFQPTAGNAEHPTCQRCLKILTIDCYNCGTATVRTRIRTTTPVYSTRYPDGEPTESLQCDCGHDSYQEVGQASQRRKLNEQRAQAKVRQQTQDRNHKERLADEMAREQAEYPHPDTCALCNQPLPRPLSEIYRYHTYVSGFQANSIPFLP